MRWTTLAFSTFALVALGTGVRSDPSVPESELKAAFAEADKNRDGQIDREEFHARMVDIFFHGDLDKNGFMSADELDAATLIKEDFAAADANRDGRLSLYEFLDARFGHFRSADTDANGTLSLEEVVGFSEP
ncbi:MAG: EF-hand domain-containing protein [Deltaproteobacteria bacterium]|nr:MAG: EF-hand domain-containing protein [Deltaproteobacteria bacterium]